MIALSNKLLDLFKVTFSFNIFIRAFLLVFSPLVLGYSIVILGVLAGVLWGVVFLSLFFLIFLISAKKNYSGEVFILIFFLYYVFWIIRKITGLPLPSLWQMFLVFSIFGLFGFWQQLRQSVFFCYGFVSFILFLIVAIVSTVFKHVQFLSMAYQFISDLKPLLLIIAGFAIVWNKPVDKLFWALVNWFWLLAIVMIFFQWLAPSIYLSVFNDALSNDPMGLFPSRAQGPFQNPSFLAASAAMFALLLFSKLLLDSKQIVHDWFRVLMYIFIIFCSVQRQELIAVALAVVFIFIIAKPEQAVKRGVIGFLGLLLFSIVFWVLFSDNLVNELSQWGFGNFRELEHPRAQIYQGAFYLAEQNFPLGSGLGTYGGAGADKFDQSLYFKLGFLRYWWFGKQNFLMDTYWPNSIAETGVLGASLLFISYIIFFLHALTKSISEKINLTSRIYWRFCAAGMLYLLILSFSAPAFQDPMLCFLPLLAFGIATFHEKHTI